MESYIQISKINDFIFCPRSVYLHTIYDNFHKKTYHSHYQTAGTIAHKPIEEGVYSSAKRYFQGMEVYSDEYGIAGKIDIFDIETDTLIERKRMVKHIFDGYRYQLYAQMVCLREMGYRVNNLRIHSLTDNKRYEISIPNEKEWKQFENILDRMKNFTAETVKILENSPKCGQCIYKPLCH